MKSRFATSQIARLVRLCSPVFNVRVNLAGNLAIEPSPVISPYTTRKFVFYKVPDGYVIRSGRTYDLRQKSYGRLAKTVNGERIYTFKTFNEAVEHFTGTLKRTGYIA